MSREWNATGYHRLSQPQVSWGKKALSRLQLRGDELLLDAGCGTGRLTADLLQSVPRGRVIALDLSQNMLQTCREHLRAGFGNRVSWVAADLQALPFAGAFDGVVSTAAFHWVKDHDLLFSSIGRALKPGGWLFAQCGGGANLAGLRQRIRRLSAAADFAPYLASYQEPWLFQAAEGMKATLERAGFEEIETSVEAAPTVLHDQETYIEFVQNVIVRTYLEQLPQESLRKKYMDRLAAQARADHPPFSLDYWRLNLSARTPLDRTSSY